MILINGQLVMCFFDSNILANKSISPCSKCSFSIFPSLSSKHNIFLLFFPFYRNMERSLLRIFSDHFYSVCSFYGRNDFK